jgi:hypothetical protein
VHREQLGVNGYFFHPDSLNELVDHLKLAAKKWGSGINHEIESVSLDNNKKEAYAFGESLFLIANEALSLKSSQNENAIPKLPERNCIDLDQQLNLATIIQQQADYIKILEKKCNSCESLPKRSLFGRIKDSLLRA